MAQSSTNTYYLGAIKITDHIDNNNGRIINVGQPIVDNDAATKKYVDTRITSNGVEAGTGLSRTDNTFNVSNNLSHVTALGNINSGKWSADSINIPYGGTGKSSFTPNKLIIGDGNNPLVSVNDISYQSNNFLINCPVFINNTTQSTGFGSGGALTISGGASISGKLWINNDTNINGNLTIGNLTINGTSNFQSINSHDSVYTNITSTNLVNSNITNTNLLNTNITNTNLLNTNITTSNITTTKLTSINNLVTNQTLTNLISTNVSSVNLINTTITTGTLHVINTGIINNLVVTNSSFSNIITSNLSNTNASLINSTINSTIITNATINSLITNSIINNNSITSTNGSFTNITSNTLYINTSMFSSNLSSNNLTSTTNTLGSIVNTNLKSNNITTVNLITTNISNTNFSSTNLISNNITSNNLSNTNITSTNIINQSLTTGNVYVSGIINTNNISCNNLTIGNIGNFNNTIIQNSSISNLQNTNLTNTNIVNTNISSTNLIITNITSNNFNASGVTTLSTVSSSNISTGYLYVNNNTILNNTTTSNLQVTNLSILGTVNSNNLSTGTIYVSNRLVVPILNNTSQTTTNLLSGNIKATNSSISNLYISNLAILSTVTSNNLSTGNLYVSNSSNFNNSVSQTSTISNLQTDSSTIGNLFVKSNSIIKQQICLGSDFSGGPSITSGNLLNILPSVFTDTVSTTSSVIPLWTPNFFSASTLSAQNAITTQKVSTLYLQGNPAQGVNQTINNSTALAIGYVGNKTGGNLNGQIMFERNDGNWYGSIFTEQTTNRIVLANASLSGGGGIGIYTYTGTPIIFANIPSATNITPSSFIQFTNTTSNFYSTTDSSSKTTGSLVVSGGIGVSKNITCDSITPRIIQASIQTLSDVDKSITPTMGQTLVWNGTMWSPSSVISSSGGSSGGSVSTSVLTSVNVYPMNLVTPIMTSNGPVAGNGGNYYVTANSEFSNTYAAYKCMGSIQTPSDWATLNTTTNFWIQVRLPSSQNVRYAYLEGRLNSEDPANVIVQGSNDGTSFTTIITSQTFTALNLPGYFGCRIPEGSTNYTYYRFFFPSGSGVNPGLNMLRLFKYDSTTYSEGIMDNSSSEANGNFNNTINTGRWPMAFNLTSSGVVTIRAQMTCYASSSYIYKKYVMYIDGSPFSNASSSFVKQFIYNQHTPIQTIEWTGSLLSGVHTLSFFVDGAGLNFDTNDTIRVNVTNLYTSVNTNIGLAGSLVFNGTNQYLSLSPGFSGPTSSTTPYTIEMWFYPTDFSVTRGIIGNNQGSGTSQSLQMYFSSNTTVSLNQNGGPDGERTYTFASPITTNTWHHFALSRNSNGYETIFLDGNRALSAGGGSSNINSPYNGCQVNGSSYPGIINYIGRFYGGYFSGMITNFRSVIGTSIYDPTSSTITLPTAPLTSVTNTRYLMLGSNVTTDSSGVQTVTNNGSIITSTSVPF